MANLMSPDSNVRCASETAYNSIGPPVRCHLLLQVIEGEKNDPSLVIQASVFLRRLITSNFTEVVEGLEDNQIMEFRTHVLELLRLPITQNQQVKKKIIDIAGELSRKVMDFYIAKATDFDAQILVPERDFVLHGLTQEDPHMKECALMLIAESPAVVTEDTSSEKWKTLRAQVRQLLKFGSSHEKQLAAHALMLMIISVEADDDADDVKFLKRMFHEDLPALLEVVQNSLVNPDDKTEDLIKTMIDFLEETPMLMKPFAEGMFEMFLKAGQNPNLQQEVKNICLEAMVRYAETAPTVVKKAAPHQLELLVFQLMELMTKLDDDTDWDDMDPNEQGDEDSDATTGETSLDRLSIAIGGKQLVKPVLTFSQQLLANADWKKRHAGLMALSAAGEGLAGEMKKALTSVVPVVLKMLTDQHPRVRHAACNCIGQMATDFAPTLQKKHGKQVVSVLLSAIETDPHHRVQAHAACAMVNFCEDGDATAIEPYLDDIANRMNAALQSKVAHMHDRKMRIVLEAILVAISSVADTVESDFEPYYNMFVPYLKGIINEANGESERLLRGKALETLTLVGMCVKKERFIADASEVMNALLHTQISTEETMTPDDPQHHYMMQAWGRICTIMGEDFAQYLPLVMPRITNVAQHRPEMSLVDYDDIDKLDDDEWEFVQVSNDKRHVGIKTSGLEDKKEALRLLKTYAEACGPRFIDYVEGTLKLMIENIAFVWDEGVRGLAAEVMPSLLKSAGAKGVEYQAAVWNEISSTLLPMINKETETDTKGEMFEALGKCIENLVNKSVVTSETMQSLTAEVKSAFTTYFQSLEKMPEDLDEEFDQELQSVAVDQASQESDYLLSKISECLESLLKSYGVNALPVWNELQDLIVRMGDKSCPGRSWAIGNWIALIRNVGQQSKQYQQHFLPVIQHGLTDERPEVRQTAAFAFGCMAECGGQVYLRECSEALPVLVKLIEQNDARDENNAPVTDNAISALTRYMKFIPEACAVYGPPELLLEKWLSWLPITHDTEESSMVFGYLADLLESNNPVVIGLNGANIPKVIGIIAEALNEGSLNEDDCEAEWKRLMQITLQLGDEAIKNISNGLNEDQQHAFLYAISDYKKMINPN